MTANFVFKAAMFVKSPVCYSDIVFVLSYFCVELHYLKLQAVLKSHTMNIIMCLSDDKLTISFQHMCHDYNSNAVGEMIHKFSGH